MELETLADQWNDLIDVAQFVADELVDEAKVAGGDRLQGLMDGVRAIQSTIRQAHKVKQIMGWAEAL